MALKKNICCLCILKQIFKNKPKQTKRKNRQPKINKKTKKSSPKSCWHTTQNREVKNVNTRAEQAKECTSSAEPWGGIVHVEADTVSLANIALNY